MTAAAERLVDRLRDHFHNRLNRVLVAQGEVTAELAAPELLAVCEVLRDHPDFGFEMLMDLAGVDYLHYGTSEWATDEATTKGYSRAVEQTASGWPGVDDAPPSQGHHAGPRFAVAYQLLSLSNNRRLRLKVFCQDDELPIVDSVTPIWNSADWYEREAFDLFGIVFEGHPDLRRILTDYGFIGHPFRKDFPLVGKVETRYDPEQARVVYQPTSIEPRVLVPRTIRDDFRYMSESATGKEAGDA